jgi:hypothetical protein
MNYTHTAVPPQSQQPKANRDLSEIPAELNFLNVAIDQAEHQLASLADHLESVLRPPQPKDQSEASGGFAVPIPGFAVPIATPLGANIQSARFQVERITTRLIDISIRIGL